MRLCSQGFNKTFLFHFFGVKIYTKYWITSFIQIKIIIYVAIWDARIVFVDWTNSRWLKTLFLVFNLFTTHRLHFFCRHTLRLCMAWTSGNVLYSAQNMSCANVIRKWHEQTLEIKSTFKRYQTHRIVNGKQFILRLKTTSIRFNFFLILKPLYYFIDVIQCISFCAFEFHEFSSNHSHELYENKGPENFLK